MQTLLALLMIAAAPAPADPTTAPPPLPATSLDAAPEAQPRKVRIYMTDGQELTALLLGENQEQLRVRIGDGAPFDIARASVRAVEDGDAAPSPENYFRDPNLSRTFYAPTGFRLRQGEGYFSQKELLFSSFGYGITDNVSVMLGTIVPLWFSPNLQNAIVGLKVGTDIGDLWHVAVGAQGFAYPGLDILGPATGLNGFAFVFGTVTCGTPVISATVSAGGGFQRLFGGDGSATPIVVASASYRVAPYVALETENWFILGMPGFTSGQPFLMLNSGGVRLMNRNLAADLGFVLTPGGTTPLPWVDFSYSFGV
jgi:hypothetical protein